MVFRQACLAAIAIVTHSFFPLPLLGQTPKISLQLKSGALVNAVLDDFQVDGVSLTRPGETDKSRISYDQIASLTFDAKQSSTPASSPRRIRLIDGSILRVDRLSFEAPSIEFAMGSLEKTVPSRNVEAIVFQKIPDTMQVRFEKLVSEKRQGDAILVVRKGQLNAIEGIARSVSDQKLKFTVGDRTADINLEKITAVTFFHAADRELADSLGTCKLIDGSTLSIRRLERDNDALKIITRSGETFSFPVNQIQQIVFGSSASFWLSQIPITTNEWQPLLASEAIYEKLRRLRIAKVDSGFDKRPLMLTSGGETGSNSIRWQQFESGFAMHGGGKLVFRLNGQYKKLTGKVGFAPRANENGNVRLKVSIDGRSIADIPLIKNKMRKPVDLDLDLESGDRLVIDIDYADGRTVGDMIHLVDMQLTK